MLAPQMDEKVKEAVEAKQRSFGEENQKNIEVFKERFLIKFILCQFTFLCTAVDLEIECRLL